jgi:hypothetical protein
VSSGKREKREKMAEKKKTTAYPNLKEPLINY